MKMDGLRIVVTGASGHIGNVVCRELKVKGAVVRAIYRSDLRALADLDVEKVQGDVINKRLFIFILKVNLRDNSVYIPSFTTSVFVCHHYFAITVLVITL